MRAAAYLVAFGIMVMSGTAWADTVSVLVKSLRTSHNYKVRVTAAMLLSKYKGDSRAKAALLWALAHDKHPTVRGTAALSLGKLGDDSVIPDLEAVLRKRREHRYVKRMAKKALAMLRAGCPAVSLDGKRVYVHVAQFKFKAGSYYDKVKVAALKTLRDRLAEKIMSVPYMTAYWPGCKKPSKRDLRRKKMKGYLVDGIVIVREVPGEIKCTVRALVATYPGRSIKMNTSASGAMGGSLTPDNVSTCIEALVPVVFQGIRQYITSHM